MKMSVLSKRVIRAMDERIQSNTPLDLISSSEDENGNLKPSRRPINENTTLTTDFYGKPMKYEKPTLPKIKTFEPKVKFTDTQTIDHSSILDISK